jgi:hypothetical protein
MKPRNKGVLGCRDRVLVYGLLLLPWALALVALYVAGQPAG